MNDLVVLNDKQQEIESKRALIKSMYAKDCSNDEFEVFLFTCKRLGLDPRAKQIYAIKLQGKMTFQIGIDGLRLVAERTGKYAPGRETSYVYDKDGKLFSATAYVKKFVGNTWHEVPATAYMSEYSTGQATWKTKPHIMLGKCAESLALRKAFPMELSGVHSTEEMEQAMEEEEMKKKKNAIPEKEATETIEVHTTQTEETPRMFGKSMAEYEGMAAELWALMREKNPQIGLVPPREMAFYLEYCQKFMANTDIRNHIKKWADKYDIFIERMRIWYEREGQYGYAQPMDVKEVG